VQNEVSFELRFWWRNISWNTPFGFAPRVSQALLTTDASERGWAGELSVGSQLLDTFGFFWTQDGLTSSNQRETAAVLRSLLCFRKTFKDLQIKALTIRSDNAATVCNLQRQGAGIALLELTRDIFSLLTELDIRISVVHLPGKENKKVDALSRMEVSGDYCLKLEAFQRGMKAMNLKPTIDMFAHRENAKIDRFVALPGPGAWGATGVDAFQQDWAREVPYMFPPVNLLPWVIQLLWEFKIKAVIVVPEWTGHAWWSTFRAMVNRITILGKEDQVLEPGFLMVNSPTETKLPPGTFLMAEVNNFG
jgi:hypothetical protein